MDSSFITSRPDVDSDQLVSSDVDPDQLVSSDVDHDQLVLSDVDPDPRALDRSPESCHMSR